MDLVKVFSNKKTLKNSLEKTKNDYRRYDPGHYLYNKICEYDFKSKFSEAFIELTYVTLAAWNMNHRQAKLNDFEMFYESILSQKEKIGQIKNENIKDLNNEKTISILKDLFHAMQLVYPGKPPLVTFSKALHFFLPDLVGPIDRTYTLKFFYNGTTIDKNIDKQFNKYIEIQNNFCLLANKIEIVPFLVEIQ